VKIIKKDYSRGYVQLIIDKPEDLWHLSQVILPGDFVKTKSLRKIEKGGGERAKAVVRKPMLLKIEVKKVEFQRSFNSLKVLGTVVEGPEDVPHGTHHSFQLEEGNLIGLEKKEFLGFQIKRLDEAEKNTGNKILICAVDRGEGYFALLKNYGFESLGKIEGETEKKDKRTKSVDDFYGLLVKQLEDYDARFNFYKIILGGPAFWKEELYEKLDDKIKKKTVLVNCNNSGEAGISEIIKRDELRKVLKEERVQEEIFIVEEILKEIGKEGKVCYGFKDVKNALNSGAIEKLAVSDSLIKSLMEENNFDELNEIMRLTEKIKGEVCIISHEHEAGAKLDGLGGIAALLRYKINQ